MYVCMYRGCPSWSAHGIGCPAVSGRGALGGFNVPTPRQPSVPHHVRWLILTHWVRFLMPTLRWAAKGDLHPDIGGTGSHRTRLCVWLWMLTVVKSSISLASLSSYFTNLLKVTWTDRSLVVTVQALNIMTIKPKNSSLANSVFLDYRNIQQQHNNLIWPVLGN